MARYFQVSQAPIVDYGFELPFKEILGAQAMRQGYFDLEQQRLDAALDKAYQIEARYTPDILRRRQLIQGLEDKITDFTQKDLTDPVVRSDARKMVREFTRDPDVETILRNTSYYDARMKELAEIKKKQGYLNPWQIDEMQRDIAEYNAAGQIGDIIPSSIRGFYDVDEEMFNIGDKISPDVSRWVDASIKEGDYNFSAVRGRSEVTFEKAYLGILSAMSDQGKAEMQNRYRYKMSTGQLPADLDYKSFIIAEAQQAAIPHIERETLLSSLRQIKDDEDVGFKDLFSGGYFNTPFVFPKSQDDISKFDATVSITGKTDIRSGDLMAAEHSFLTYGTGGAQVPNPLIALLATDALGQPAPAVSKENPHAKRGLLHAGYTQAAIDAMTPSEFSKAVEETVKKQKNLSLTASQKGIAKISNMQELTEVLIGQWGMEDEDARAGLFADADIISPTGRRIKGADFFQEIGDKSVHISGIVDDPLSYLDYNSLVVQTRDKDDNISKYIVLPPLDVQTTPSWLINQIASSRGGGGGKYVLNTVDFLSPGTEIKNSDGETIDMIPGGQYNSSWLGTDEETGMDKFKLFKYGDKTADIVGIPITGDKIEMIKENIPLDGIELEISLGTYNP